MLDQVLRAFEVIPDYDLGVMHPEQSLCGLTARILNGIEGVLEAEKPEMVIVQGDTTTSLCGALAGFYSGAPVGHVEAGLRTGTSQEPFPEEMNRVLITRLASLHLAPTELAARNLETEGVPSDNIFVTGNSGIDAVVYVQEQLAAGRLKALHAPALRPERKLVLVTAHRREKFGPAFERVCEALRRLAERGDVEIVYPVHQNPNVWKPVQRLLGNLPNVILTEPLDYVSFTELLRRAYLVITDSGGVQEEAPSLGRPVLVIRENTERLEAVESGSAKLVGSDPERILQEAARLLDDPACHQASSGVRQLYGDGRASRRIADAIQAYFSRKAAHGKAGQA